MGTGKIGCKRTTYFIYFRLFFSPVLPDVEDKIEKGYVVGRKVASPEEFSFVGGNDKAGNLFNHPEGPG